MSSVGKCSKWLIQNWSSELKVGMSLLIQNPSQTVAFYFSKNILRKTGIPFLSNSQLEVKQNILGFPGLFGNQFGRKETLKFRPVRRLSSNYTPANSLSMETTIATHRVIQIYTLLTKERWKDRTGRSRIILVKCIGNIRQKKALKLWIFYLGREE